MRGDRRRAGSDHAKFIDILLWARNAAVDRQLSRQRRRPPLSLDLMELLALLVASLDQMRRELAHLAACRQDAEVLRISATTWSATRPQSQRRSRAAVWWTS